MSELEDLLRCARTEIQDKCAVTGPGVDVMLGLATMMTHLIAKNSGALLSFHQAIAIVERFMELWLERREEREPLSRDFECFVRQFFVDVEDISIVEERS